MCVGNFRPLMLVNRIHHTKSESDLFLYVRNLYNEFSLALNSQRLLCSQKAGSYVRIKAFWYTNT